MRPPVAITEAAVSDVGRRRELVRLCAVGSLAYCSYAMCRAPLLPLFARDLGADAPMVGFVVGASTLTGIFLKLPAGAWSDVLGRRPLLVAGGVVFAVMPFTYLGIASLGALVAVRFVHGSATAIFGPVASASLSDIAPPQRRSTWLSTYSTMQGAGQAIGPIIAGYLLAAGRFDLVFMSAGVIALAAPLIVAGWPTTYHTDTHPDRLGHFTRGIAEVSREPLILITSLAQAAQFVLNGTLNAFLPLFAREELGLGLAQLGWLFGVQTVTTLATRPIMGTISDRVGRRGVICSGLAVCSASVVLVSLATGLVSLTAAVLLYAVGVAVTTAATSAFITDLSQRARYGAAHGVFGTIYDIGDALGPIGAGLLVAMVGYAHMFRVMAAIAIAAGVGFYVASRDRREGARCE
jgi:DHA1 family multidrug resistance protein-like MFS transporter